MPVQGSAADLIKLAMVKLEDELQGMDASLLLQVHDELVVEAAEKSAKKVAGIVEKAMSEVWKLRVPLEVDVGMGDNWLEAK